MGSSDNFCLRWNDFESNISTSFRELREDNEFFDVTLCCDNGVDLVQAHKVILAACSPLFRKILAHQRHQQNPLLYLKGIRLKELQAVLNFMYHGEVNVAQDSLNNFLAVAEELAVKGLTTDSQPGVSDARKKAVVKRKSVPHTPASNSGAKKAKSDDEDHHQEVDVKRIKAEPEPSGSGQQAVMGDEGGIGDDSYAGDDGADDFGDGEDFEGFAQYGDGQEFDESIAGASGSGGGDGKDPLEDDFIEPVKGYVSGRRGKYSMVDQRNFLYYFHVPYKNKMRWRCIYCSSYKGQKMKCNAGAYTIKNNIVKFINEHNHPPTYDSSEKCDLTPSE